MPPCKRTVCLNVKVDAAVDEVLKATDTAQPKLKKLIALQSKYSDSDGEETREQRKTRMVCIFCCF